ncbi:MAG TPA: hypothetical protein VMY42_08765 [Thermoguttaceae bacterium]|nr:hypothetical protein [Thermoguttaceae bacterium]
MYRIIAAGTVAAILWGTIATASVADEFYWTDITANEIRRAGLDGSNAVFVAGSPSAVGLAVDAAREKVYWTDDELKKIRRCNLDGTGVEDLVTSDLITPRGIALDPVGYATRRVGKMYWTDEGTGSIRRADLDGLDVETLVTGLIHPREIALDPLGGKMYWADSGSKKIQRANLDGSVVEDVVASRLELPRGIALDMTARKVYWTDGGPDKIQRADLDGSRVEDLIASGLDIVRGIALDPGAGKMYFVDAGVDKIFRADLGGQGIEELRAGTPHPWSIVLASAPLERKPDQLRIVVDLDGSDRLYIDPSGARWVHRFWSWPKRVHLNGVPWEPSRTRHLKNEAETEFLAPDVDFASAKLTVHEGRDTAVLEHAEGGLILHLCDSPNGRQTYDMTITFGMKVAQSSAQDRAVAAGR